MVTVSILLNPGMSKMCEQEQRRGKEKELAARDLGAGPELRLPLGPWGSPVFYSRGTSQSWGGQGESLGPPSH